MKRLLKMHPGILFTVMFVIPFATQIILVVFSDFISWNNAYRVSTIVYGTSLILYFLWIYVLGTSLHSKKPEEMRGSVAPFMIIFFLSVAFTAFSLISRVLFVPDASIDEGPMQLVNPLIMMAGVLCSIYCFYFVARSLVVAENQKEVLFNDFSKEIILIWAAPYGVWFIQPRIQKLFDEQEAP